MSCSARSESRSRLGMAVLFSTLLCIALIGPGAAPADATTTASCVDPPHGLVAWWGGDGNAGDVFGSYSGEWVGDPAFAAGQVGQAFSFDGSGDFVMAPDSSIWDFGTSSFSLAVWFKTAGVADYSEIMSYNNGYGNAGDYFLDLTPSGTPRFGFCVGGGGCTVVTGSVELDDDAWHLAVAVLDQEASQIVLYVDGALAATPVAIASPNIIGASDQRMTIGAGRWGSSGAAYFPFPGLIDEAMAFNLALTLYDAQSLYTAGSDGACRPCAAVPPGAVGWWRGQDDAVDAIGGNDGVLSGDTSFVDGMVGRAFNFDGNYDYVALPNLDLWDFGTGSFAITAWFKTSTAGYRNIIRYHDGANTGLWGLRIENAGKAQFIIADSLGPLHYQQSVSSDTVVTDDAWHMVTAVRDADNTELRLYLDGVAATSPVVDAGYNVVGSVSAYPAIGALSYTGGAIEFFAGLIDEVMVLDAALTDAQVLAIYNANITGHCTDCAAPPDGMVSWWQGEDSADDHVGNNHGTEVNGATYATGLVGQAFSLEALDDYVEVADDPSVSFAAGQPMTVDLWAYRTGSASGQHLIGKRTSCGSSDYNYMIVLDLISNSGLCFAGAGAACSSGGWDDLPLNAWTHLAGAFDGTNLRLYINGQEAATAVSTLGGTNSAPLTIGTAGTCGASGYDFEGLIDEVEIHDRALSPDEIYAVYSAGVNGKCIPDTVPDSFAFVPQLGVGTSTTVTSNAIVVSGINTATTVTVSACTSSSCEYSVNGGSWTDQSGTVVNGNSVAVRQLSAASYGTTTDLELNIGGVTGAFSATTLIPQYSLSVSFTGNGSGSVSSAPAGIDCPDTACSALFDLNEVVTLTPAAEAGSNFHGFIGDADCSDGEVTVTGDLSCTAIFEPENVIFSDGFETGGTGRWSASAP